MVEEGGIGAGGGLSGEQGLVAGEPDAAPGALVVDDVAVGNREDAIGNGGFTKDRVWGVGGGFGLEAIGASIADILGIIFGGFIVRDLDGGEGEGGLVAGDRHFNRLWSDGRLTRRGRRNVFVDFVVGGMGQGLGGSGGEQSGG